MKLSGVALAILMTLLIGITVAPINSEAFFSDCEERLFRKGDPVCYFAPFNGSQQWFSIEEDTNFLTLDLIQSDGTSEGLFTCQCEVRHPSRMICTNTTGPREALIGRPSGSGKIIWGEDLGGSGAQFKFNAKRIDCSDVPQS